MLRRGLPFGVFMTIGCLVIDLVSSRPIDSVGLLAVKFGFHTLAFGLSIGGLIWNDRERDFQEETDEDVA